MCVDKHAGISNHTIWQWGKPSNGMEFSTQDIPRPNPPGAVEEMVRMVSKHLVEVVVGHKPGEGNANAQRRYNKLSRFYVVANRYEQDAAIGTHSDYNALYAVHPQQQVVISCNMVADGVLWISPTQNGQKINVPGNRPVEWAHDRHCGRRKDRGKLAFYAKTAL